MQTIKLALISARKMDGVPMQRVQRFFDVIRVVSATNAGIRLAKGGYGEDGR